MVTSGSGIAAIRHAASWDWPHSNTVIPAETMTIVIDTTGWIVIRVHRNVTPVDRWLEGNGLIFGQDYLISDYGVFADVRLRDHALISALVLRWG